MLRATSVAGTVASLALTVGSATPASTQPSDRSCLIAWNSAANHANHVRLLAERPILGLMLTPGVVFTDTWTKTSSKQTGGPACLLTVAKRGQVRNVTGMWMTGGVKSWKFGPSINTRKSRTPVIAANVRLLADGRVTKIYRR